MSIKIGLDAGHGLKTSGKQTPDGIKEWTLNDKVRDKVVKILSDYDCEIIHTDGNEGKTDETLSSRLSAYMKKGCSVFVSIHHNANTGKWNNATGVEIFTDNNPTAKDNELAKCIYDRLVKYTGMKRRGIKKCDFYVINQDKIPAVLVEGGFMDSHFDHPYITSDKGQTAYAKAVAEGLIEFLNLKKKKKAAPKKETTTANKKAESFFPERGYFKKGDKGENVEKINDFYYRVFPSYEEALNRNKENVKGDLFGENSVAWTKEFQRRTGLEPDGYFGPLTLKELEKYGFKK